MKKEELLATLSTIAQEYWDAHQLPVLLSQLPKELEQRSQADYKSLLDSGSLKSFIKETQADGGYRLVEHPVHRAKVGIVPTGVEFEFSINANPQLVDGLSRQDIEGFSRVLHSLTSDELRSISLPASLVVRLLDLK